MHTRGKDECNTDQVQDKTRDVNAQTWMMSVIRPHSTAA